MYQTFATIPTPLGSHNQTPLKQIMEWHFFRGFPVYCSIHSPHRSERRDHPNRGAPGTGRRWRPEAGPAADPPVLPPGYPWSSR
jgi:hypothetical protein